MSFCEDFFMQIRCGGLRSKYLRFPSILAVASAKSVGSLGDGSILHKTGYNYGIDGASKYYNPFYVTYRGNGNQ